jgi:uncharacterized membrane protein YdbT with pleckstrin-like domain
MWCPREDINMGYIDNNLMNNENVIGHARLHWAVYMSAIFWFSLGVFLIPTASIIIGGICILISFAAALVAFLNQKTSEFGVTNKRVLLKTGLIHRSSIEVLLAKVERIQVDQGILGRILGYGSVTVTGTGGSKDPYHRIAKPLDFRKKVQEQVCAVQDAAGFYLFSTDSLIKASSSYSRRSILLARLGLWNRSM